MKLLKSNSDILHISNQFWFVSKLLLISSLIILLGACHSKLRQDSRPITDTRVDTVFVHDTLAVNNGSEIKIPVIAIGNCFYKACDNRIRLDVPADITSLSIDAIGADVEQSKASRVNFSICPQKDETTLKINAGREDGTEVKTSRTFCAVPPPKPGIFLSINGKEYEGMSPIPRNSRAVIFLKPDRDFLTRYPADARYIVDKIEILAQLSLGPPKLIGSLSTAGEDATKGISVPFGADVRRFAPGTKIYVRLNSVNRVNFKNETMVEPFSNNELIFGIVIR